MTPNLSDTYLGTVIHGTHRHEDLVPAFLAILETVNPEGAAELLAGYEEGLALGDHETPLATLDYLFDALDAIAPVGAWFGAHPGDGADFGFWTDDEY